MKKDYSHENSVRIKGKNSLILIIILVVSQLNILFAQSANGFSRGRVSISNGTVVTDRNTLLRGCRISTDAEGSLPPRSDLPKIKKLGLNSIHLYGESFAGFWNHQTYEPGSLYTLIDSVVNWTREDSLYLVLTIGNTDRNGEFDYDFALRFWEFYAPRYADETHVIYEIHNEPFAWTSPYPDSTINMERDLYNLIRSYAPDTHILFLTYASPQNPDSMLVDLHKLGDGIDWSNASVAIHGYDIPVAGMEESIQKLRDNGYSVINTEPCNFSSGEFDVVELFRRQLRSFEKNFVSYLNFIPLDELLIPEKFKTLVEDAHLSWTPDFGSWPPPATWDAFSRIDAEFFSYSSGIYNYSDWVGQISNQDYIMFEDVNFGAGASSIEIQAASGGIGGICQIIVDSLKGEIIGQVEIENTGGWDIQTIMNGEISNVTGRRDLFLKFTGGEFDLFDIDWFIFSRSETDIENEKYLFNTEMFPAYPNPFNPATKIKYSVAGSEFVQIQVYNLLGEKVAVLVSGEKTPGTYEVIFDAGNLPSGVYICVLSAGNYSETKKLLLLK